MMCCHYVTIKMTKFPQQIQSCGLNDHQNCYSSISSVKKKRLYNSFLTRRAGYIQCIGNFPFLQPTFNNRKRTIYCIFPFSSIFVMFLAVHSYQCFTISQIKLSIYNEGKECLTSETKTIWKMLMCML